MAGLSTASRVSVHTAKKLVPSTDFNPQQTAASRADIENFLTQTKAQLWIQHDYTSGIKRKLAPEFYD